MLEKQSRASQAPRMRLYLAGLVAARDTENRSERSGS